MRKILKAIIPLFLFTTVLFLSSCDNEGKGKTYFKDTTWKATWTGTGNNTDTCAITLKFNSDMTGKISFDFTKEENEDFEVNFLWDAWVNKNNFDTPYVQIVFNPSEDLKTEIQQTIESPVSLITAIDMAGKKSSSLSTNFSCDILQYVCEKYLGYTHDIAGSSTVYIYESTGATSSERTGTHFPQFNKQ